MTTFPLLQSQMGVYHAWMADPTSVAYNLPAVVPFPRSIDPNRLERALHEIWEKRQELHTQVATNSQGEPLQWADASLALPLTHRHLSEKDVQSHIRCGFVRPFAALSGEALVRFEVIETEAHHYLLYDMHHLIADGLTLSRVFLNHDLPLAYSDKPLPISPYGMYQHAEAEHARFGTEQYQRDARFYQERFQNTDFTCLSVPTAQSWGTRLEATATADAPALNAWCRQRNLTPNLLFMAAFSLVLARLSGNMQVAFTSLHHGRTDRRLTEAYGMFVGSVPVLATVAETMPVLDFIHHLRQWLISTLRHSAYPLTHLCRDLRKTPSATFAFQGEEILEQTRVGGNITKGYQLVQGTTRNDLSCTVYLTNDRYEVRTEASQALWSQERLHTIATAVATCAESLMAHPDGTLADIDIITPTQQEELLQLGQGERLDYDPTQTVVTLFLQQAQRTPDALAVTDGCTSLTYQELDSQSAAFAQQLQQEGVQPGDFVPITIGRCTQFLVQAIGIMRMGAAYVPIDTNWPQSRQQQVIMAAQATKNTQGQAYLLYTSGTTGTPKGVMISHRALLNLVHSIVHIFGLTAQSRISCHSSFAFDASVEDLFPVLTVGGSVHIMPEDILLNPERIHHFLLDHHITGGCYTTHLGIHLAQHFDLPMDYLCLGGEQLTTYPHTHPRVFNTYGPTEFTVDATYCELPRDAHEGTPPIGRPLPNLTAYVMDAHGHLQPRGEVGELCLAGVQQATNCTDTPYHTGDLVRWNEQGQLEYVGRRDRQLKLRGYRIEPEEIERKMEQMDGIQQAVVVANPTHTYLAAYFTASLSPDDERLDEKRLSERLSQTLPHYMVPTRFIWLDEMPLTTADKPDYAQLPPLEDTHAAYTPPANETEALWCELFAQTIGIPSVGATDNFFHLGGTSILVATLQAEAQRHGIPLSYADVFAHPTPRQLANIPHTSTIVPLGYTMPYPSGTPNRTPRVRLTPSDTISLSPLLLTGATGILGSHLLHEFLTRSEGLVYCLVRANNEQHALARLTDALRLHTGFVLPPDLSTRIVPLVGDLLTLTPHQLPAPIATVIHCAADVRHFAADHAIETTNIQGTDRIIDFCLAKRARLVHLSTLSADAASTNPYIQSKGIAEQHILQAISAQGLQATILRVGNLIPTSPDDAQSTTLQCALNAFRLLGQYPHSLANLPIDRSPADQTAQAILLLTRHAALPTILPVFHPHLSTLSSLLQQDGDMPLPVSGSTFQTTLTHALAQPELRAALVPLLHYQAMTTSDSPPPTLPDITETLRLLAQYGFQWHD